MSDQINNESPMHKYFTMMLNITEDDLDPFAYRLLAHYIRWTGHGGSLLEGIRTTADKCKMSIKAVRNARKTLTEQKYITVIEPTKKGQATRVFIHDRWLDNIQRYATLSNTKEEGCVINDTPPVSNMTHIEELEKNSTKDSAPQNGAKLSSDEHKAVSELIEAWLTEQKIIDSGAYGKTGYRTVARDLFRAGITPDNVRLFLSDRMKEPFWQGKTIPWGEVQKNIARWIEHNNQPSRPKPLELTDPLPPEPVYPG